MNKLGKFTKAGPALPNCHGKEKGCQTKGHGKAYTGGGKIKTRKATGKNLGTNVGR